MNQEPSRPRNDLTDLNRAISSGNLEDVKRAADSLFEAGGDPIAALTKTALSDLSSPQQKKVALNTLKELVGIKRHTWS